MGARRPLAPALVQEYFQQSSLKKPIPTNKVFTIKILTKGAPITGRCHSTYSCTVMLLCVVVLTYKGTTRYSTNSQLGPLYDCRQPQHLQIFGFPSLKMVLIVCYNKKPPLRHSVGKSFDILMLLPPSQSTIAR